MKMLDSFDAGMLPADTKERLEYYGSLGDEKHWGVAKEVKHILAELEAEGVEVPMMKLYDAVAEDCRSVGESVRMWYGVYEKIPADIFKKYVEDEIDERLSFHQFKALVPHVKSFGKQRSVDFEEIISKWFDHCAKEGKAPQSVTGIRSWVIGDNGGPAPEMGKYHRHIRQTMILSTHDKVPHAIRQVMKAHLEHLDLAAKRAKLEEWEVPNE